jgi:hypothetical protein
MDAIRSFFQPFQILSGGANDALYGQIYQAELFLYLLQKSKLNFDGNYGLSTELSNFKCFDDAILKAENFGALAMQAKWKRKPKQLNFQMFVEDNNYVLYKYFIALKDIIKICPDIRNVYICTNNTLPAGHTAELSGKYSKLYVSKVDSDSIFSPFTRYKLGSFNQTEDQATFSCLRDQFITYELLSFLRGPNTQRLVVLKAYKATLFDKIIDENRKLFKTDLRTSSDAFAIYVNNFLVDKKVDMLSTNLGPLIVALNTIDPQEKTLTPYEVDQLLRKFISKFELIVNLERTDLENEIIPLLQKELKMENIRNIKKSLACKIINWITNLGQEKCFDSKKLEELNADIKNDMECVKIIDRTSRVFKDHSHLEFKEIEPNFRHFIKENPGKLQKRIFYCKTQPEETLFASLQFYRILEKNLPDTFIYLFIFYLLLRPSHSNEVQKNRDNFPRYSLLVPESSIDG